MKRSPKSVDLPGLRSLQDSVADIAAPRPEFKHISGTSDTDFAPTLEHDDSGISEVLGDAIDSLSGSMFQLPFSVSIALPCITDTPLIGISDGFCHLSGYTREEIIGQNCRFLLKGVPEDEVNSDVRQEARRYCRAAHLRNLTSMAHSLLLQRNARKNGELFWNLFMLTLVPGPSDRTYVVGLQLDLGPKLPSSEKQTDMETTWFKEHRENLLVVQSMLFGNKPGHALGKCDETYDMSVETETFLGLAEDIQKWLGRAEEKSTLFQSWGTLPWVAWPGSSKHALLNGGVSLLRLEADRISKGAVAMSIFPVLQKPGARCFKVRIDDVCQEWGCDLGHGAVLPTLGFTLATPAQVDKLGGLPEDVESTPQSVMLISGGRVRCHATELDSPSTTDSPATTPGTPLSPEFEVDTQQSEQVNSGGYNVQARPTAKVGRPKFAYKIKEQDTLECTWGKGYIKIEVAGEVIFHVKSPAIFAPPRRKPAFAFMDCAGAVCRATLLV